VALKAKKATPKSKAHKAAPAQHKKVAVSRVKKTQKLAAVRAARPSPIAPPPPRPPTQDESAALGAFEKAHKEFSRGRFAEARNQFRILLDKYSQVSEVAARARTYLAIAESRLRTESILPRDADSLYDRGVIELNRGEYVAAQEMFERALKREPEAAHIHYGLAATRARLGSIDLALQSLQRALDLQPNLRVRAQHDHDLNPLRNDPDFDRLIFSHPS
jgi:tetratricopeptide (TPR) repeat protein